MHDELRHQVDFGYNITVEFGEGNTVVILAYIGLEGVQFGEELGKYFLLLLCDHVESAQSYIINTSAL